MKGQPITPCHFVPKQPGAAQAQRDLTFTSSDCVYSLHETESTEEEGLLINAHDVRSVFFLDIRFKLLIDEPVYWSVLVSSGQRGPAWFSRGPTGC